MEGEEHLTLWELLDSTLSLQAGSRPISAIEKLLPWFHERSTVFKHLDDDLLQNLVQRVKLQRFRNDFVLVHQGAIGNCFYIVVKGHLAVHAKRDDEIEGNEPVAKEIFTAKGSKDRARFGPEMCTLGPGRCFGELCVVSDSKERNASVITDEAVTLICVEQHIYTEYVPEKFAKELLLKSGFVNTHPLFKGWPTAYRNLLIENLQERTISYGETVVRQGETFSSIGFIMKGQANIYMVSEQHYRQYPKILHQKSNTTICNTEADVRSDALLQRDVKWNSGFFAAELRARPNITVAAIGPNSIIGDLEAIWDLKTYAATFHCIQEITLFEIDLGSFIRIVFRKSPETFEKIRKSVLMKMKYRSESIKNGIPLYEKLLKSGDGVGKDEAKKILSQALKKRKKKRNSILEQHRASTANRHDSLIHCGIPQRSQRQGKMRMSINPATGEVTIASGAIVSDDDRRRASEDWENSRRRFSISRGNDWKNSTETKTGIPAGKDLTSIEEEEEGERSTENNETQNPFSLGKKVDWRGANKMLVTAVRITGQRTEKPAEDKKNFTMQEYKDLKRKMQTMSKTTHRVSSSG